MVVIDGCFEDIAPVFLHSQRMVAIRRFCGFFCSAAIRKMGSVRTSAAQDGHAISQPIVGPLPEYAPTSSR